MMGEKEWEIMDFVGKYHKHRIGAKRPIPGTAVERDVAREAAQAGRWKALEAKVSEIQGKYGGNVRQKCQQAQVAWQMEMQRRVGANLSRTAQTLGKIEAEAQEQAREVRGKKHRKRPKPPAPEDQPPLDVDEGEYVGEREMRRPTDAEEAATAAAAARVALDEMADEVQWWRAVGESRVDLMEVLLNKGYGGVDKLKVKDDGAANSSSSRQKKDFDGSSSIAASKSKPGQNDESTVDTTTISNMSGFKTRKEAPPGLAPLHLAVRTGNLDMTEVLLKYGADPNVESTMGDTALLQAWLFWDPSHAKHRRSLADFEARRKAEADEATTVKLLRALLDHGAYVDATRRDLSTALFEAVRKGPVRAVELLLQRGANANKKNVDRETPVSVARTQRRRDRLEKIAQAPSTTTTKTSQVDFRQDPIDETYALLSRWAPLRVEAKYEEFTNEWRAWLAAPAVVDRPSGGLEVRTLRQLGGEDPDVPAAKLLASTQLALAQRELKLSVKRRAHGVPFFPYDPVKRAVCCPPDPDPQRQVDQLAQYLEENPASVLPPQSLPPTVDFRRRFGRGPTLDDDDDENRSTTEADAKKLDTERTKYGGLRWTAVAKKPRARPASPTRRLAVPLDQYLLREVDAKKAGFLETGDLSAFAATDRDIVLDQIKRKARKRRQELRSKRPKQGDNDSQSTVSTTCEDSVMSKGRQKAATAVLLDAQNEGHYHRAAAASRLLNQRLHPTPDTRSKIPQLDAIYASLDTLRTYDDATTEMERVASANPLNVARARSRQNSRGSQEEEPFGLELGTARRKQANDARKLNELDILPPSPVVVRDVRDVDPRPVSLADRRHTENFTWEYRKFGAEDQPTSTYQGRRMPQAADLQTMIRYAADLQNRPTTRTREKIYYRPLSGSIEWPPRHVL